jgi:hypothetical protein
VNLRVLLVVVVLGFIGLLLVMGAVTFVRWLREAYPQHFRLILAVFVLSGFGLGIWIYLEAKDRPDFHANDLITLGQPLVVRVVPTERLAATASCIVEIYEHLAIVEVGSSTLKARVESNKGSGPSLCPIGVKVQFERAWLELYTLTHRHA